MKNKIMIPLIILMVGIIVVAFLVGLKNFGQKKEEIINHDNLVCSRNSDFIDTQEEEKITIYFDENAIINKYVIKNTIYFSTEQNAMNYYKEFSFAYSEDTMKISKNKVVLTNTINITQDNNYYGKNRQQIREIFANELFYDCGA